MANPTTAAEWKEVAANAQAQIGAVNQQKAQGEAQITALEQQLLANGQQISDYLIANPRITSRDPGLLALQAQTDTIKQNLAKTEVYVRATLTSQLFQLRATINNANTQAGVASTGAPNTSTNTPPETVVPDQSNTAVTTTTEPEPVQQSVIDPNTDPNTNIGAEAQNQDTEIPIDQQVIDPNSDPNTNIGSEPVVENATPAFDTGQNAAADAAFQEANASEQQVIDPNSDPNTNIGNDSQEQLPQPQQTISLASDPNTNIGAEGQTPVAQQTIDPNSDPNTNIGAEAQTGGIQESVFDPTGNQGAPQGISTALNNTRSQATKGDTTSSQQKKDWRAKLSLAPKANYLYKVPPEQAGILKPLQATDGVIFPYTPAISVTYAAGYDISELVHSNYKIYQYKGSSVDAVSITADFTAQDTTEATYLLAVIHFFRSVTKMFYGQDQNPKAGVPPPLCYLSGFGAYTFDAHPLVVTNFTYATPTDVDYIRAGSQTNQPGVNIAQQNTTVNTFVPSVSRIATNGLQKAPPNFQTQNSLINSEATYVPTKLQLQITCIPIVTRNDISNTFSLEKYATGQLLRGSKRSGGGIW
jgi:hypothetical protein